MKAQKFKVPTLEEVKRLFELKGVKGKEPDKFYYYYESNGWYVGKSKMRSWRAAAVGWMLRMEQFHADKPKAIIPMDTSGKTPAEVQAEIEQIKEAYKKQRV